MQSAHQKVYNYISTDALGGPKVLHIRTVVNFFKMFTFFYLLVLMKYFNNFSLGSTVYLAMHGTYGFIWLIKDMTFPDKNF